MEVALFSIAVCHHQHLPLLPFLPPPQSLPSLLILSTSNQPILILLVDIGESIESFVVKGIRVIFCCNPVGHFWFLISLACDWINFFKEPIELISQ